MSRRMWGVALVGILGLLVLAGSASAYTVDLTVWNTTELNTAGDKVVVTISGNTISFQWVSGNPQLPNATNIITINWSAAVGTEGGTATGTTTDYTTIVTCGGSGCTADGFGKYAYEVNDANTAENKTTGPVSFTFANSLTDFGSTVFTSSDFALHVQYDSGCSGWVDGSHSGPISNTNCTAVPEPITMFLGGTGLLALGYAGRKRLFGRGAQLAS